MPLRRRQHPSRVYKCGTRVPETSVSHVNRLTIERERHNLLIPLEISMLILEISSTYMNRTCHWESVKPISNHRCLSWTYMRRPSHVSHTILPLREHQALFAPLSTSMRIPETSFSYIPSSYHRESITTSLCLWIKCACAWCVILMDP